MKAAPFDYARPATVTDAVAALGEASAAGEDAKVLAGGQSLVPLLALRLARPTLVVDLNDLAGLDDLGAITLANDELSIGALVRHRSLCEDRLVRLHAPLLARAASWIGHRAIRARGTIGGSLAHADPAAELPLVCQVLGAEVELAGPSGRRRVRATELFSGPLQTVVEPDELIIAVHLPSGGAGGGPADFGFAELARRPGDFALSLAAVTVTVDADGTCRQAAVGVGGTSSMSRLVGEASRTLVGTRLDDASVAAATDAVRDALAPQARASETAGSVDYQLAMAGLMVRRAISDARGTHRGAAER